MVGDDDSGSDLIPPELTGAHRYCHCKHVGKLLMQAELLRKDLSNLPSADDLKYALRDARTVRMLAWIILPLVLGAFIAALSPKVSVRFGNSPPSASSP